MKDHLNSVHTMTLNDYLNVTFVVLNCPSK